MRKTFLTLCFIVCILFDLSGNQTKIDSLTKEIKVIRDDTNSVNSLNALSWELILVSSYEKGIYYANQALAISKKIKFLKGESKAFNYLGGAYWNLGNYPESLKNYYESLRIAKEINYRTGIATTSNNIGLVYWNQGKYAEALKSFLESQKIYSETNDKKALINTYNNLGLIYYTMSNLPEALKNYQVSLQYATEIDDKRGMVQANHNIALVYQDQGRYKDALQTYFTNIALGEETGDKKSMALAMGNIGMVLYFQGSYDESVKYHLKSIEICDEIGIKYGLAINYINLGRINILKRNYNDAGKWLKKGLAVSFDTGDKEGIKNSYLTLAALDSAAGDWKKAYEDYKLFTAFRDSLLNEENTRKTVQLQMQHDFNIKDAASKAEHAKQETIAKAEIEKQKIIRNAWGAGTALILISGYFSFQSYKRRRDAAFQKKAAEAKQQEAELKQQVSEVEMMALRSQMNPHFIFNSLNSIYRYMEQHDIEKAGNYLVRFSKLIRMILENSRHEEVSLREDMHALELYMQIEAFRLDHAFDYTIEIDPALDPDDVLIPPLLLQPFVENAIWHGLSGKTDKGHLFIRIKKHTEKSIKCEVEDDGTGRKKKKEDEKNKIPEKKGSLGIAITRERIELNNRKKGTHSEFTIVDLTDAENKPMGTRVEVLLPLSSEN